MSGCPMTSAGTTRPTWTCGRWRPTPIGGAVGGATGTNSAASAGRIWPRTTASISAGGDGTADEIDDPGRDERLLLPRVVPSTGAAVAGAHLGLEQVVAVRGQRTQPGDPLGRLVVEHPGVVEAAQGQDRRVRARAEVLVRRV